MLKPAERTLVVDLYGIVSRSNRSWPDMIEAAQPSKIAMHPGAEFSSFW
jgi:hypothetical protein